MFSLAHLKLFVHSSLELFPKGIHFLQLLVHQILLVSVDLFRTRLQIGFSLLVFHLVSTLLHLMSILVFLLLGQIGLHLA